MAERFVVDNSVVMSWCFEDETSKYADAVLTRLSESKVLVPSIWPLEITNVLLAAQRKGRLTRVDGVRFIELLRSLPIEVDHESPARVFANVYSLAHETGLSSYDASYLDLAMREGIGIATLDKSLRNAARHNHVALVGTNK